MKVIEVINHFKDECYWVNWNKTRDIILHGDSETDIKKIGVCWVATNAAIESAIKENINLIITHENLFYKFTTEPEKEIMDAINAKKRLLDENNIVVFRCHDCWDYMPEFGVADQWAKALRYSFEAREVNSLYQYANINSCTSYEVCQHVIEHTTKYNQNGVCLFGRPDKLIRRVAIGTGAATDIFKMMKFNPDLMIVSDDGINNWVAGQYAIDHDLALVVVNHINSEIPGIEALVDYFNLNFPEVKIQYLAEEYEINYYSDNRNQ